MKLRKITRNDLEIAFYVTGTGPYLLGLSGFACSHYNFVDLLPELEKNFTVVLVDNRGCGNSAKTKSDYKIKDLALDALAVMDFLNVAVFGLMGISMGGFIAQEIYKCAPQKIAALALMCTTSGPPLFLHSKKITEGELRELEKWDPQILAEFLTSATTDPSLKINAPEQFQRIVNLRLENRMDLEEKIRQNNAAVEFLETDFDLSIIKCPVYAMAGENDRFLSPTFPQIFKTKIPQTLVELIPKTDHFFFLEKPIIVGKKLNKFFKENYHGVC